MASLEPTANPTPPEKPTEKPVAPTRPFNPRVHAPWWKIMYSWLFPFLLRGYRQPLQEQDLFQLEAELEANTHFTRFAAAWAHEKQRCSATGPDAPQPSLLKVLFKVYWRWCAKILLYLLASHAGLIVGPICLQKIVAFMTDRQSASPPPRWHGGLWVLGLTLVRGTNLTFYSQYRESGELLGMLLRTTLISALYTKSLGLSGKARLSYPNGKIMNIMSTDVKRIHLASRPMFEIVATPLFVLAGLALLVSYFGVAALAGMSVLIAFMLLQTPMTKYSVRWRLRSIVFTDQRLRMLQQTLSGIRVIKMFGWEPAFQAHLDKIRHAELRFVRRFSILKFGMDGLSQALTAAVITITLIVFDARGGKLDPSKAFAALALLMFLRVYMTTFPKTLTLVADAWISVRRVRDLLLAPEIPGYTPIDDSAAMAVRVDNGGFEWESCADHSDDKDDVVPFKLEDIELSVPRGGFVGICGAVGAGKSSLMEALIGEMRCVRGSVTFGGSVSYCPQVAWIQNATLRDNILFGSPFDGERYWSVIHACALDHDLSLLPHGDMTEIGERGINLSGGQKQRVNIARAMYSNTDIILLDDPLSAVDAHVGRHLFQQCLQQALASKTRLLVTHQLHFLRHVDHIVCINQGRISEQGTFDELMAANGTFAQLMSEYSGTQDQPADELHPAPPASAPSAPAHHDIGEKGGGGGGATADKSDQLMTKEERVTGLVKSRVLLAYAKAAGGWPMFIGVILPHILWHCARIGGDFWMSKWTSGALDGFSNGFVIGIFCMFGGLFALFAVVTRVFFVIGGVRASSSLTHTATRSIFRAPVVFFDTTPLGRILNRFSQDVDTLDNLIAPSIGWVSNAVLTVLSSFIVISVVFPYFLAPLAGIFGLFYPIQLFYRATSRELKRLESETRSPVFSHFSETLTGLSSVRAYRVGDRFMQCNLDLLDANNRAFYLITISSCWLTLTMDLMGAVTVFFASLFCILASDSLTPAIAGLVLSYALSSIARMSWLFFQVAEAEQHFNAVERLVHYAYDIDHEAPWHIPDKALPRSWPHSGAVQFSGVQMRYRPGLPCVLQGLSFSVQGGERIGIVGRTGAGKSSIAVALLRLTEIDKGVITMDGVDIGQLGLHDVRRCIAIIPQDSTLFQGTIRLNLDPASEFSDAKLWDALDRAGLKPYIHEALGGSLEAEVTQGGENLSVGQRQLLCLARALLVEAKVIVLDEATASVDLQTDAMLQEALRMHFANSTVLTIAHRLNTIIDYDRVLVMDNGHVAEFDRPSALLDNAQSLFSGLVDETGPSNAGYLRSLVCSKSRKDM